MLPLHTYLPRQWRIHMLCCTQLFCFRFMILGILHRKFALLINTSQVLTFIFMGLTEGKPSLLVKPSVCWGFTELHCNQISINTSSQWLQISGNWQQLDGKISLSRHQACYWQSFRHHGHCLVLYRKKKANSFWTKLTLRISWSQTSYDMWKNFLLLICIKSRFDWGFLLHCSQIWI